MKTRFSPFAVLPLLLAASAACSKPEEPPVAPPPAGESIGGLVRDASGDVVRAPADPSPPPASPHRGPAGEVPEGRGPADPPAPAPDGAGTAAEPPPTEAPASTAPKPPVPAIGEPATRAEAGPENDPLLVVPPKVVPQKSEPSAPDAAGAEPPKQPDPAAAPPSGHGAGHRAPARPKAADGAASLPEKAGAAPAKKTDGPEELSFDVLADFDYPTPDPEIPGSFEKAVASIPREIKALDGNVVLVEGYMIPMRYSDTDDGVVEFMLCRFQMGCCFGVLPKANELVEVAMPEGKSAEYTSWEPVRVVGKIRVGPRAGDQTALSGIYRIEDVVSVRAASYEAAPR